MCGVVGYSSKKPVEQDYKILYDLIIQSKIRGLHSFGYTFYDEVLTTKKYHNLDNLTLPASANKIIYHNRYSTSGDYKLHENNQPIPNTDMSLVFNGVIDMRTKEEMQNYYNIKMHTDNDGEILLHKCSNKDDIKEFVQNISGSFAGLILTKQGNMYAIRNNNRPLWRMCLNDSMFYASTKDIFKRVNNAYEPEQLIPNVIYES
jgi:glutamine phosphoribosylpyrophosphate amidotransferase